MSYRLPPSPTLTVAHEHLPMVIRQSYKPLHAKSMQFNKNTIAVTKGTRDIHRHIVRVEQAFDCFFHTSFHSESNLLSYRDDSS